MEFAFRGAAGVLAVPACALVQRAHLWVGGAAGDAGVHEVASAGLDDEPAGVAAEPLGGLDADRACAFEQRRGAVSLRCTICVVGLRLTPSSLAAGLGGERDERIRAVLAPLEHRPPALLVGGAVGFGDVPDRLLERDALFERQRAAELELAPAAVQVIRNPRRAIQRLVVGDERRDDHARDALDLARRLADRDACEFGVGLGRRELGGGDGLVERELAAAIASSSAGRSRSASLARTMRCALR